jgi:REP element-mobilizing transposase RayT
MRLYKNSEWVERVVPYFTHGKLSEGADNPREVKGPTQMNTSPAALFITWTVYGTFLPGDSRGWSHRSDGQQLQRVLLEQWHRDRLAYPITTLDESMRLVGEAAIREICWVRSWYLWAVSVRSNHVHVLVTAPEYAPKLVRNQLKAKATRDLRAEFPIWDDRPIWSENGDIEFLDSEEDIEQCARYVSEAQDRMDRK